jgi:hypothetical protein
MKEFSRCHLAPVETKETVDGVSVHRDSICTKCGEVCMVLFGTKEEAKAQKADLDKQDAELADQEKG